MLASSGSEDDVGVHGAAPPPFEDFIMNGQSKTDLHVSPDRGHGAGAALLGISGTDQSGTDMDGGNFTEEDEQWRGGENSTARCRQTPAPSFSRQFLNLWIDTTKLLRSPQEKSKRSRQRNEQIAKIEKRGDLRQRRSGGGRTAKGGRKKRRGRSERKRNGGKK